MTQLTTSTEMFEKLLDVLDHRILQIKEALREMGLTEEATFWRGIWKLLKTSMNKHGTKQGMFGAGKTIPEFQGVHSMPTLSWRRNWQVPPQRGRGAIIGLFFASLSVAYRRWRCQGAGLSGFRNKSRELIPRCGGCSNATTLDDFSSLLSVV